LKIIEALRIAKGEAIAIVGAGGKTSLMFALANAALKPVCLTTTTKIERKEAEGDIHHLMFSEFEIQGENAFDYAKINLVTNPLDKNSQKWSGLSLRLADHLISTCQLKSVTCLIEADGARHLSLKAPATWEPVIPKLVNRVIVVVGLSVIGKPLNAQTVFRPELFSILTGLPLSAPIQLEHIVCMLNHPEGGLKGIPASSKAAVVFNQSDAYCLKPGELDLVCGELHDHYSNAILTSLRLDSEHCEVIFDRK